MFDTRRATNEQVQNWPPQNYRKTKKKLQKHKNKKKKVLGTKSNSWWIHTKEFSLFNVYLLSAGQKQGLYSHKAIKK